MTTPDEEIARQADEAVRLFSDIEFDLEQKNSIICYLMGKARMEARMALLAILNADPAQVSEIARLQGEALRFVEILHWLRDAVSVGQESIGILKEVTKDEAKAFAGMQRDQVPTYEDD
jgi:hypothetical protein